MEKKIKVCAVCGYNHVEQKAWVDVNTNEITEISDDLNGLWCRICSERNIVIPTHNDVSVIDAPDKGEIVGFQVVGVDDNDIHPKMDASFCIYNYDQAIDMMVDKPSKWKLVCIYKDDIEEPTFMFEGKPF